MRKLVLFISSIVMINTLHAQLLYKHKWQDRVILTFAHSPQSDAFGQQLGLLTAEPKEVTERDLVHYQVFPQSGWGPDGAPLTSAEREALYHRYGPKPAKGFKFVIIGKDGTVKLTAEEAVSTERLFGIIDRMPMRRAEMRQQQKDKN